MQPNEMIDNAKNVLTELETLRVEIGLDKPRRSLLTHTLAAKEGVEAIMRQMNVSVDSGAGRPLEDSDRNG